MDKRAQSTIITQLNKLVHRNCVILNVFDLTQRICPTNTSFTEPTSTHTPALS